MAESLARIAMKARAVAEARAGMSETRECWEALRMLRLDMDGAIAGRLLATALLVVAGGVLSGLAPLALKGMVDAMSAVSDRRGEWLPAPALGAAYVMMLCGGQLLAELRAPLGGSAEQRLYGSLRCRFFARLLQLGLSFHLARRTGSLVQSVAQATSGYQIIVFHLVNGIVPVLVELVTVTVVLLSLRQPTLMIAMAGTALAYLSVLSIGAAGTRTCTRAVSEASLETQAILADSLLNYETIKAFGAEGHAQIRFADASRSLERSWIALYRQRARVGVALSATVALSMAASLWLAMHAVADGTLSVGGFVLTTVYMLQVVRPLEMLGAALRDLSQALAFIRPMLELFAAKRDDDPTSRSVASNPSAGISDPCRAHATYLPPLDNGLRATLRIPDVSFRDVSFSYRPGRTVIRSLDLDIPSGQAIAIVGASGSGKSTLVRLLLRLQAPQSGSISLCGAPIEQWPIGELREAIGWVPQDIVLFNETLSFNIGIGKSGAPQEEIERAARIAQLHDFAMTLPEGYATRVGERGLMLSGGERQRIAIARAVLRKPRVLVLDEATSMLDALTEEAILSNLRKLSHGCTTITIAHRLAIVRAADEIVVLGEGRLLERGSHAALLARGGAYERLWRAQLRDEEKTSTPERPRNGRFTGTRRAVRTRASRRRPA